jgi:methionyl-tRNA formyltransferase
VVGVDIEGSGLRILVCTKADLPSLIALNALLPPLRSHRIEVLLTDKTRPAERTQPALGVLKFLERDLPVNVVCPMLERREPAEDGVRLKTFGELAAAYDFPIRTISSINKGDGYQAATAFVPDLVLSIRFSLLFRQPMLRLARHGILNLHPGPLPGYGGLFAIFRQMLAGQHEIGVTLHQVDAGIDTGPVVAVTPMPVVPGYSMLWHVLRAYRAGVASILAAIESLEAGHTLGAVPQDPARMCYYQLPEPAQFIAFASAGLKLYDFEEYVQDLRTMFGIDVAVDAAAC